MTTDMETSQDTGRRTWDPVARLGGEFMRGPHMAEKEAELGIPERTLYLKGRVAVVGDVTPYAAQSLYGIFPNYYVSLGYRRARSLAPSAALAAYVEVC